MLWDFLALYFIYKLLSDHYSYNYTAFESSEAVKCCFVWLLQVCSHCHRVGATLGCFFKDCPNKYHFPCALQSGNGHQFACTLSHETKNNAMYILQNYSVSLVALIVPLKKNIISFKAVVNDKCISGLRPKAYAAGLLTCCPIRQWGTKVPPEIDFRHFWGSIMVSWSTIK